jgi:hypothetical protein
VVALLAIFVLSHFSFVAFMAGVLLFTFHCVLCTCAPRVGSCPREGVYSNPV